MEPVGGQEPQAKSLIYANWVRVGGSPFEMSIDLGYRPDPAPPAEFPVSVIMSWEHAKTLQRLVNAAVKSYEEEVGPIREFEGKIGPARPAGQIGFDQGEEQ